MPQDGRDIQTRSKHPHEEYSPIWNFLPIRLLHQLLQNQTIMKSIVQLLICLFLIAGCASENSLNKDLNSHDEYETTVAYLNLKRKYPILQPAK